MKTKLSSLAAGIFLAALGTGFGLPTISSQPQDQTNLVGTTAMLAVQATGAEPLAYQWQQAFDLIHFVDRPEGTNATLVITNVQTLDAGLNRAIVTNSQGAATSEVARVYVVPPPTLQFSSGAYPVAEDAGSVTVSVRRTGYLEPAVSVDYATVDGTATNGVKYTAVSGTLAFGSGETNKVITVRILNDGFIQGTKTFRVVNGHPPRPMILIII